MPKRRVLVVDDEPLIAALIVEWLEQLGYEPLGPARTVEQAIAMIDNDRPDAAILDVSLGDEHSYSVADRLKTESIPFAFATGRDRQSIPPAHANVPLLIKPYDLTAITEVMENLRSGSTLRAFRGKSTS